MVLKYDESERGEQTDWTPDNNGNLRVCMFTLVFTGLHAIVVLWLTDLRLASDLGLIGDERRSGGWTKRKKSPTFREG